MSRESVLRKLKRQAMVRDRMTFAERLIESIRTGMPMKNVVFKAEGKRIVVDEKK